MQKWIHRGIPAIAFLSLPIAPMGAFAQDRPQVASPDGRNVVALTIREGGLFCPLKRAGNDLLFPSRLGFVFGGAPSLRDSLRIVTSSRSSFDSTWTQPWGEVAKFRDHHNQLRVTVQERNTRARKFDIVVRAFNDGIGFRYEIPSQPGLN